MSLNKELMLQNLEMLILQGNPLHKILLNVFEHGSKLQLTDISHVNLYSNFLNKVSDSLMCCILSGHIEYMSKSSRSIIMFRNSLN